MASEEFPAGRGLRATRAIVSVCGFSFFDEDLRGVRWKKHRPSDGADRGQRGERVGWIYSSRAGGASFATFSASRLRY